MKPLEIGGQAVLEGVMMKYKNHYAVAVRTPENEIITSKKQCRNITESGITSLPIIRGVAAFIESLRIGMKTLSFSSGIIEDAEEKEEKESKKSHDQEKKEALVMGIMIIVSMIAAAVIFIGLPFFISNLLKKWIPSEALRGLIEGIIRVVLFVTYVKLISQVEDIKRVFMYHGAEHKAINCIENGLELTVENVKSQSKVHKRCGTSFLLFVMLISVLFFLFIVVDNTYLRVGLRLLLIPVIAGVAYEFIRFAGRSQSKIMDTLSKPGLWLQKMTTNEPEDDMIEVAIASVNEVFDWETYLTERENQQKEDEQQKIEKHQKEERQKKKGTEQQEDENVIQIVGLEDEDEDEILKALDRYFDAPEKEPEK